MLSIRVREIVFSRRSTSYSEVANLLIKELTAQGKLYAESVSSDDNVFLLLEKECQEY
jgi:hypothetical protein